MLQSTTRSTSSGFTPEGQGMGSPLASLRRPPGGGGGGGGGHDGDGAAAADPPQHSSITPWEAEGPTPAQLGRTLLGKPGRRAGSAAGHCTQVAAACWGREPAAARRRLTWASAG